MMLDNLYQDTNYGDRDGDGVVDSTDKGTPGSTCTGTVTGECRILDLDFDGDYDSADATLFDTLDQGLARHPGRPATNVDQPFAHQGLLYDPELTSYQNRARQYMPTARRFAQRDPLAFRRRTFIARQHYQDGMTLYGYVRSNPILAHDAFGLVCGSGWTDAIVPDEPNLPGSPCPANDYTGPCVDHDACYATCGSHKDVCDEQFHDDMIMVCSELPWYLFCPCGMECHVLARIYYEAVDNFGDGAYDDAQADCGG